MTIITRFAPSPTGKLHIGGLRTAIFNYLFAKKHNGKFFLRIEDTDVHRSKEVYKTSIKNSLRWMGINWDKEFFQSSRYDLYIEIANTLIKSGNAYYCKENREDIERFYARNSGKKFVSKYRDKIIKDSTGCAVRLKVDNERCTELYDALLGNIKVQNIEIDDMVILRADNTPTYVFCCAVDDYYMNISHVIRGNDHLTNTLRQIQIFNAMDWRTPVYCHIPLIHNAEGKKLSKRDGDLGIEEYIGKGYTKDAIFNYLIRLGWSYKDTELISMEEAIKAFDLVDLNKSPAKFNQKKLDNINKKCIQNSDDLCLIEVLEKRLYGIEKSLLEKVVPIIKNRAENLNDLIKFISLFTDRPKFFDDKSSEILAKYKGSSLFRSIYNTLLSIDNWKEGNIKMSCEMLANNLNIKLFIITQIIRAAVFQTFHSPPIFASLSVFKKQDVLDRILPYI